MRWDIIISALIGAITIGLGILQFRDDSQHRAQAAQLEARKPFLERQMELCFAASEVTATLATTTDQETWDDAYAGFWTLYWGPLSVVEQPIGEDEAGPVEQQMVLFGRKLNEMRSAAQLPMTELELMSLDVAHRCRDLIFDSWDIKPRHKT